jgi:Tfp pilus assembly protein PilN
MINLLPQEEKRRLRAARMNVTLLRYLIFIGGSLIFMLLIFSVGYYITTTERAAAKQEYADLEQRNIQYADIRKEAEGFEKNLSTAKSILSSEVLFSELVTGIARDIPGGVVLNDLSLTTASLGEDITINARTKDRNGGLRLKTALQKSEYFDNVSIQTITNPVEADNPGDGSGGGNNTDSSYPYAVIVNATLVKPDGKTAPQTGSTTP